MICLLTRQTALAKQLRADLAKLGIGCTVCDPASRTGIDAIYHPEVAAIVVDVRVDALPEPAWQDMLASLGRRIPVLAIGRDESVHVPGTGRLSHAVTWLGEPTSAEVIAILDACGVIGAHRKRIDREGVPIYNPQVPLNMLKENGALSVLTINASSFRKIAIEYGNEAYQRLQDVFQQVLFAMWGTPGSFRSADTLCRRAVHSNTFYIFLEQSRLTNAVPAPGVLEHLADRLLLRLQNTLWGELFLDRKSRRLPDCISTIPEFAVGHSTAIYNPCVDSVEMIEQLLDNSAEVAKVQMRRMKDRQRELMQTLIQTADMLMPNYQAVFRLPGLTKEMVDQAAQGKTMKPLKSHLYGFESLIRVRREAVDARIGTEGLVYLESRFLRPDVMFALAQSSKVALELDQACLSQATTNATRLPGVLMVNILPRNLYHVDRIAHLLKARGDIMFEVSESEAISNFDLMIKVREHLARLNMGIATDDFGKGFAGLERIIKIKPDLIKLDRSLVENIHEDEPKQAFVRGLVEAAKITRSVILAEGVEKWEEAKLLQSMGIDLIQGYLLHRPQAADVIHADILVDTPAETGPQQLKKLDSVA